MTILNAVNSWSFNYKTPEGSTTIFITEEVHPHIQIFIGKAGSSVAAAGFALAEMTSFALESRPIDDVIDKLSDISSDRSTFVRGVTCRSTAEALAFALLEYSRKLKRKK